jgi:hypothetical protein
MMNKPGSYTAILLSLLLTLNLELNATVSPVVLEADLTTESIDEWSFSSFLNSFSQRISWLWSEDDENMDDEASADGLEIGDEANLTPIVYQATSSTIRPRPRPVGGARILGSGPRTSALLQLNRLDQIQMCTGFAAGMLTLDEQLESHDVLRNFMICPLSDAFNTTDERLNLEPTEFCDCVADRMELTSTQGIGSYQSLTNPSARARQIQAQVVAPAIISTFRRYDELLPQMTYALSAIEFRESLYEPAAIETLANQTGEDRQLQPTAIHSCTPTELSRYFDQLTGVSGEENSQPVCSQDARRKLIGAIKGLRNCQSSGKEDCLQDVVAAVLADGELDEGATAREVPEDGEILPESQQRIIDEGRILGGSCSIVELTCQADGEPAYSGVPTVADSNFLSDFLTRDATSSVPPAANDNRAPAGAGVLANQEELEEQPEPLAQEQDPERPDYFGTRIFQTPSPDEIPPAWERGRAYYHEIVTPIVQYMINDRGDASGYTPSEEHLAIIRRHIVRNPQLRALYSPELIEQMARSEANISWSQISGPYLNQIETEVYEKILTHQFGRDRAIARDYPEVDIIPEVVLTQDAFNAIKTTSEMGSSCILVKETLGALCHALDGNEFQPITSLAMSEPLLETLLSGTEGAQREGITSDEASGYHQLMIDTSILLCSEHNIHSGGGTRLVNYTDPQINIRENLLSDLYAERVRLEGMQTPGEPTQDFRNNIAAPALIAQDLASNGDSRLDASSFIRSVRERHLKDLSKSLNGINQTRNNRLNNNSLAQRAVQLPTSEIKPQVNVVETENEQKRSQPSIVNETYQRGQAQRSVISSTALPTSTEAIPEAARSDDEIEREQLFARLEENQLRENELRQRMRSLEENATSAQYTLAQAEQQKQLQEIANQLAQLRLENELMRQRATSLPTQTGEGTVATSGEQVPAQPQPVARIPAQNLGAGINAHASAIGADEASASSIDSAGSAYSPRNNLGSGGARTLAAGSGPQATGRIGDARYSSLQASNSLVLMDNVFNADATETMLALNAVGAVAYRRTSNPSIIERILFATAQDGSIQFNEQGEPIISSIEQIQASLVEFLPATPTQEEVGRSPASIDSAVTDQELRADRAPVRYFQLEQILLESLNENP